MGLDRGFRNLELRIYLEGWRELNTVSRKNSYIYETELVTGPTSLPGCLGSMRNLQFQVQELLMFEGLL